jgi:hypothetical protein
MRSKTTRYLLFGQLCLWMSLVVCSFLLPGVVFRNDGISAFGVNRETILPYGVGFLICGYMMLQAALSIERQDPATLWLARALSLLSFLLLAVLVTPFSVNAFFDMSHMIVSGVLFLFELVFALWLVWRRPSWAHGALFGAQLFGSLMTMSSILKMTALLPTGQLIAQLAFGILLLRIAPSLLDDEEKHASS